MGALDDVVDRIRYAFQRDKERGGALLAKGSTSPTYPDSGYDLLQSYGYDALSDYLRLEHDLLSRYVDYEEMDDYPEIACLAGDSKVFTLERGWSRIDTLVGTEFHVLAYDRKSRSLVPARASGAARTGEPGHSKPMVRVTLDDGSTTTCTADHLFLTKDGSWVEAGSLVEGTRLMPGVTRMRSLNSESSTRLYWQVHQPHSDSELRSSDGKRWTWVHRLVAETFLGASRGDVVHHKNHCSLDNSLENLAVMSVSEHAHEHIAKLDNTRYFPEWTEERRQKLSERMLGNSHSKGSVRSEQHRAAIGAASRRPKSAEHRRKIGESQPTRINIPQAEVEAALLETGTIAEAARSLGVSWSWMKRRADSLDLHSSNSNHRVLRVEPLDERPAVYDIQVPGFRNFVCNGVVVHNSAIDIYADDSSQPDTQIKRTIWVTSQDKTLQTHLDDWMHKRLRMDEEIWEIARSLVKYGNDYEEMLINHEGVVGLNFLPAPTVRRIEGARGELHGFIQDFKGRFGYSPQEFQKILSQRSAAIRSIGDKNQALPGARDYMSSHLSAMEPWEVVHFRLRGKHRRSVYGYCERASSKVSTLSGLKEIQHIKAGDEVFVLDNGRMVSAKVKNVVCNGDKKVFSVKTRHRENFATAEHPFLVVSKTHLLEYKAVQELRKGDMLVIPRPAEVDGFLTPIKKPETFDRVRLTPHGVKLVSEARKGQRYFYNDVGLKGVDVFCSGSTSIDRSEFDRVRKAIPALGDENAFVYHGRCRGNFVHCPEYVDTEFAWFFGLLLGDGWTAQDHDVAVAVSLDEQLTERIRGCFRRYGLDPKDRFQKIIDEETGEETRVLRQLCAHSADFVDILKDLGFVNGSKNKRVPQWLFQSSRAIREAFVDGFVTADGWNTEQHGQKAFRVELANYDLVRDLKAVVDSLGWTCGNVCARKAREGKISSHPAMLGRAVNSGPGYILHFRKVPLFEGPFALEAVVSVTEQETPPEPVYDIEVDHPAHNFVADGVVVHNSVLESSRWIWKRLLLMEDAAMIYRLQRAQERYAFYVDTGDLPPAEALAFVNKVRQQHRKKKFVNPSNNKMDLKFAPISPDEDFYIPVKKGVEGTRIETLGSPSWQHMEDVNYFRSKLLAAMKVPKAYLAQEEGASKTVLSSEDVRFARSVLRVQRELRNGMKRMARVHLAALKVDPSRVDFEMNMTVPSAIYELAQIEVRNARADLATRMREHVSLNWVLSNVYGLTDSDIERVIKERSEDVVREGKAQAEVEKMSMQAQQSAAPPLEGLASPSVKRLQERVRQTPKNQRGRITEEELFRGSKEAEKRATEKLDKLLRNDAQTARRLGELGGLIRDVAYANRTRG